MKDNVILYDGYCNLCNQAVNFIRKYDRSRKLILIPNQSDEAKGLLISCKLNAKETDSVIYLENETACIKSEAIFRIAKKMGGFARLILIFRIFPKGFTDWLYELIAENRHAWFGQKTCCHPVNR